MGLNSKSGAHKLYLDILVCNFVRLQIGASSSVLDIGCGNGDAVFELLAHGYDAYGVDIEFRKNGHALHALRREGRLREIDVGGVERREISDGSHYTIPFKSDFFAVIASRAVVEHVRNLRSFAIEISRLLAPDRSYVINYYPSKFAVIESHTGVPFGGAIRNELWYRLMCGIGFCFSKYRRKGRQAYDYVSKYTTYRHQKEIDAIFSDAGLHRLYSFPILACKLGRGFTLLSQFKIINILFSVLRSRVVVYKKISSGMAG